MCGIFGIVVSRDSNLPRSLIASVINNLFRLSESRGKEASGVAVLDSDSIRVLKDEMPASTLIRKESYGRLLDDSLSTNGHNPHNGGERQSIAVIGHDTTACSLAAGEVYQAAGVPVITHAASGSGVTFKVWRAPLSTSHSKPSTSILIRSTGPAPVCAR